MRKHPGWWQIGGALLAAEGYLYGPAWRSGWPVLAAGAVIFFAARWCATSRRPS